MELLTEIYASHLSIKSQKSSKGSLINECIAKIREESRIKDTVMLKDAMRNAFALCLQRDRNAYSPFSTTQSGQAIVKLLNSKKYKFLAYQIVKNYDQRVQYGDLRAFVSGKNNAAHFNAKNSKSLYQFFKLANSEPSHQEQDEMPKFLANNMKFYLAPFA